MSDEYQGQPDYVVTGFLKDLFEPWVRVAEGDEWGEHITAIWEAAETALSASAQDHAQVLVGWLREEFDRAFADDWWGLRDDHLPEIVKAQAKYDQIVAYWRELAKSFKGEEALEATISKLPSWVRPTESPRGQLQIQISLLETELSEINTTRERILAKISTARRELEQTPENTDQNTSPD